MGKNCWSCTESLDGTEAKEHLLLNAIGGVLKVKGLLCDICQKDFGDGVDVEMAKQLNFYANLANIKRDRGAPPNLKGVHEDTGVPYELSADGKPIPPSKPEITKIKEEDGKTTFQIKAVNHKIAKQTVKGLARKHDLKNIDFSKIDDFKPVSEEFNGYLKLNATLGGEEMFRAIMKTMLNFYFYNGGVREYVDEAIEYCRDLRKGKFIGWYQQDKDIIIKNDFEILHGIVIKGDPLQRVIYAYAEFFNVAKFIGILSTKYDETAFEYRYLFNIESRAEIDRKILFSLTVDDLKKRIEEQKPNFEQAQKDNIAFLQNREDKNFIKNQSEDVSLIIIETLKNLQLRIKSGEKINIIEEVTEAAAQAIKPSLTDKSDEGYSYMKNNLRPTIIEMLTKILGISL